MSESCANNRNVLAGPWVEKPVEKRVIFAKTEETDLDRFHRFLVNRPVKFDFSKI
jgi:hypothetical protein